MAAKGILAFYALILAGLTWQCFGPTSTKEGARLVAEATAEMEAERPAREAAARQESIDRAVARWMKSNCIAEIIEPKRRCDLCQNIAFPGRRPEGDFGPVWDAVSARLGGAAAVNRGVTYCHE